MATFAPRTSWLTHTGDQVQPKLADRSQAVAEDAALRSAGRGWAYLAPE